MSDKLHKYLALAAALAVAAITAALAPGGPANGHPTATMWLQFSMAVIAALGLTTLKPLFGSDDKSDSSPTRSAKLHLLPLFLAFGLMASGCAGWPVYKNCAAPKALADAQDLVVAVVEAAASQNYVGALEELRTIYGDQAPCIAAALAADKAARAPSPTVKAHLQDYIAQKKGAFVCPTPASHRAS